MKSSKGTSVPFFFPICIPAQRDNALLSNALKAFEAGHYADALIGAEYACRRYPENPVPAILRARVLQACRPEFVAKAWYRAWFCDPENPALQDAMLRAWMQSGATSTVLELGPNFLPARCRNRSESTLLDILHQAGLRRVGACWRDGLYIEGIVYQLSQSENSGAKSTLVLQGETSNYLHTVDVGSIFRIARMNEENVWSIAFSDDLDTQVSGQLLQGSPIVFPSMRTTPAAENRAGSSIKPAAKSTRKQAAVDIIIPVYLGHSAVMACINSVLASLAANETTAEVIVIDDASPEPALSAWLETLAQSGRITLLRNRYNLGFIESVNRGMRVHEQHDVMLLNADTVVHGNWIDRLRASLYGADDIASVSPWSNNGEITSFPYAGEAAPAPSIAQAAMLDRVAADLHEDGIVSDVELPACCGYAMMIRRSVLDRIGMLDGTALTRGYGEEVDWCQRARAAGYRHLASTAAFIAHTGTVSFRFEKRLRVQQNRAVLAQRYPDYRLEYHAFLANDPLRGARKAFRAALEQGQDAWLVEALAHKDATASPGYFMPAPLPSSFTRIAVWQHCSDGPHAGMVLELARLLASRRLAVRLLIIGEVSEALWHTGVVDALPIGINSETMLLADTAMLGLTGCETVLAESGERLSAGIDTHYIDDGFRPAVWLANWLKAHHARRTQATNNIHSQPNNARICAA